MEETPAPELFISHASEDKDPFVRALANALMSFGVRVWYDEFELKLGDSLSRSIDEGLSRTAFGLVVLSKSFFAKRWTEYELRGLTAREVAAEGKVILPVWLGVTKEDVLKFSPPLADKYAVVANRDGDVRSVARKIIEVVAPHRYSTFRAIDYALKEDGLGTAEPQDEPLSSPPRNLPMQGWSFVRANLVFACLPDIFPPKAGNSFDAFMSDLSREVSPELEIRAMEAIASAYHWTRRRVVVPPDEERPLLGLLMNLSVGRTPSPELLDLSPEIADVAQEEFSRMQEFASLDEVTFTPRVSVVSRLDPEGVGETAAIAEMCAVAMASAKAQAEQDPRLGAEYLDAFIPTVADVIPPRTILRMRRTAADYWAKSGDYMEAASAMSVVAEGLDAVVGDEDEESLSAHMQVGHLLTRAHEVVLAIAILGPLMDRVNGMPEASDRLKMACRAAFHLANEEIRTPEGQENIRRWKAEEALPDTDN